MKKILLVLVAILSVSVAVQAQNINGERNAIGVRGGWGVEASYQRYIAPMNRIEATIGMNRYGFLTTGTYQWMFDINSTYPGQFKWYVGGGVGIGVTKHINKFEIGILAQGGVQYEFENTPIMLSFDYRPGLYFTPDVFFDWTGFAVGVRFVL